ncbi:PREDICTED: CCAAT/enhancer-binding protein gamma-like [Priapulus caudatus]|uniref:CCAAT/enhancer-binding protein gamma-like n=1 Tax=Priapulus caudatus TaxID=37621 RepID=A0ABM1EFA3_PRICU|nr:PREDICTED: CCAAT/enhancer-binding protein gamma-like [Priapulus caudatus]
MWDFQGSTGMCRSATTDEMPGPLGGVRLWTYGVSTSCALTFTRFALQRARSQSPKRERSGCISKESEEYRKRRQRNNIAVKKSRVNAKMRSQMTMEKVSQLKQENERLESKVKLLTKELGLLRDLLLSHAAGSAADPVYTVSVYSEETAGGDDARVPSSVDRDGPAAHDHEYATVPQVAAQLPA